ncbi:ATP-binding cassette domain-containing protein [Pseudonocardia kunmingensis]|uniref:Peptide/nickel transport system ATP-binding protein/oligopeptide transport system ATP-binding protein n=1 Tax=Pseudonocardia kunmingensis TaxID=630975 RepID=A0A543DPS3_9PSEU|nr:ATP-binding cassette domain-containing protein [Pseudonocardia kunmingensis]TQM11314.1 peptide/nickel transport system ATP-binding protein/oligopeptide transport system ATP-binding protein [Pseudonocardia kunmingensis]
MADTTSATGSAPALTVTGLRKSFPAQRNLLGRVTRTVDAVRGVDFEVRAGETLALVGESGAGKSTVGRLVLRLIDPDAGEVGVLGRDITQLAGRELRAMRGRATMIFQDPYKSLDPRSQIRHSLAEPLIAQGRWGRRGRVERLGELLERVGLAPHYLDRFPYEMSGGQLQRVAVARALATDPELVVCDEPVAALDMSIRSHVINLLRDLQRERNLAYLFVSHDLSLVRVIADRIAVMRRGEIVECRPTAELFADPQHSYTRELLSAIPAAHPRNRTFRAAPAA